MILKYGFLAFLSLVFITASDPYYGTILSSGVGPAETPDDVREIPWLATDSFDSYLQDKEGRIDQQFAIAPFYKPMVRFWFFIYTQFDSGQVVFHDKKDLSLIYRVLDFSSLHKKKLSRNTIYVLQKKIIDEKYKELKAELAYLSDNPFSLGPKAKEIHETLRRTGVQVPVLESKRRKFFKDLSDNVRAQTGQKNFIREGIIRSLPYQKFLKKYFAAKNLPKELLAIPFLESSFNPNAHSKVNALGAWQFMPLIASYFVPKRDQLVDYRSNVGVSSVSAGFLLEQNFKILKSWDLAVTAYNSGTKHLLKTKRELASNKVSLEDVIKNSDSKHFGFASKNFFSEFLALAHTLAYEEEIFQELHQHDREDLDHDLNFYLTKCQLRLDKVLLLEQLEEIGFHNHHLRDLSKALPKAFILTSKSNLPESRFLKLDFDQLVHFKPIEWNKFLKSHSCSTK